MEAKQKYFKYKAKYLALKNKLYGSGTINESKEKVEKNKTQEYDRQIKEYEQTQRNITNVLNSFLLKKSNCGIFVNAKCVEELTLFNKYIEAEILRVNNYYQTLKSISLSIKNNLNNLEDLTNKLTREKDRDGLLAIRELRKCFSGRSVSSEKLKTLLMNYLSMLGSKNDLLDAILETYQYNEPIESNKYVKELTEITNTIKKL
jgi:hypothetical protein